MKLSAQTMKWTREPKCYHITSDKVEIITERHTDLWQRTYYHFRNDNALVLQISTDEKYFSFILLLREKIGKEGVAKEIGDTGWMML